MITTTDLTEQFVGTYAAINWIDGFSSERHEWQLYTRSVRASLRRRGSASYNRTLEPPFPT